jgi:hypothetical protein
MRAAKRRSGWLVPLLLTILVAGPLLVAPPLVRGFAADAWVKHYAEMVSLPRPRRVTARALVEKVDLAVQNLAPLPQASAAAIRALDIGQRVEQQDLDGEAALVIYRGVRASCNRVRDRLFSGAGFAVIEARAAALEASVAETPAK